MSAVLLNIVIGLATSVLSGGTLWIWQRATNAQVLRRKMAFFGFSPGGTCLILMNNKWDMPGSASHDDVQAMLEVAILANGAGCDISVQSSNDFRGSNGDRTEFCIGGPESSPRTAGHLASQVPGISVLPVRAGRPDSGAFVVGGRQFLLTIGELEHVLVVKFTPPGASRPVMVICGQTAVTNRAAMHYLKGSYREVSRLVTTVSRFCIMIKVGSSSTYGYQAAGFECDLTAAAFTSP